MGILLGRSLTGINELVNRSLSEVRLAAGLHSPSRVPLAELIEDVEVAAALEAKTKGVALSIGPVDYRLVVHSDRQLLASAVSNLLQNAINFTPARGHVSLRISTTEGRVRIEIEDECGGLPPGKAEELFRPFERRGANKTGLGLGLTISRRAVAIGGGEIRVRDLPGKGCVFTIDVPTIA